MRITKLAAIPQVLLFATLAITSAHAQSSWHVERTLQIGGIGGMDYLTVDPATHFLYVPRTTHTLVIDSASGKTVGDIPGQKKAHGVALVPKLNRGFISDGEGSVTIFDLKTNAVLGVLASAPDTDGILYDPGSDHILISAGDSNALITFKPEIDPKSGKIDAPIQLGGAPEFLAADGAGKVYVNLEDKDTVAVVDLKSRSVVARWPVTPGGAPVGMAIDPEHHNLFIGCRKPAKMIVISTATGKVVANQPIGTGVDATGIVGGQAFASSGDGTLTVIDRANSTVVQTVQTARGAKTLGVDTLTGKIYLPTADFEELKPGTTGRPKAKPDSFKILVVSR
ncbi:DNA-binding beta-propeller fold protein YncE [Granulicella aggregans]|uniref:DNA-binding beta-propeller fold protein YncE n=1 Tax=Granulicella aggregans TaxID=474949 RepID=A0A7W7ZC81_9BACT|nr:YncE family protein [Granulicella aggregans]MBB5057249.1 DNA-binding beta-propeller fold protein YncE [Granulicella aggregans]